MIVALTTVYDALRNDSVLEDLLPGGVWDTPITYEPVQITDPVTGTILSLRSTPEAFEDASPHYVKPCCYVKPLTRTRSFSGVWMAYTDIIECWFYVPVHLAEGGDPILRFLPILNRARALLMRRPMPQPDGGVIEPAMDITGPNDSPDIPDALYVVERYEAHGAMQRLTA